MPIEIGTLQDHTTFVGEGAVAPGTTLMFCNGINNPTPADAQSCAQIVSEAFGGRRVEIFHNPTSIGNVFDSAFDELEAQWNLSALFAEAISQQIASHRATGLQDRDIRILIFVHSHGARVLKDAIGEFNSTDRPLLHLFTFGGAQMLPCRLGAVVENYVHEGDTISSSGTMITSRGDDESHAALTNAEQIYKGMSEGKTFGAALFERAWGDLYMHLSPIMSRPSETREIVEDKRRRFSLIFDQHNQEALVSDPYFVQQFRKYSALFLKYAIYILPGTPFVKPEFTPIKRHSSFGEFLGNIPSNLVAALGNTATGIGAMAKHGLENHAFESYSPLVGQVAMRYLDEGSGTAGVDSRLSQGLAG